MKIGSKEFNQMVEGHIRGKSWVNDIEVEIEGGPNEMDTLTTLRMYDKATLSVDDYATIASAMTLNKVVRYSHKGKELCTVVYTGGDLGAKYAQYPYLLDLLFKLCFGVMLKKLTPPLEDSENAESQ